MFDLNITFEEQETRHRMIVSREYSEDVGMEPEEVVAMAFTFLLEKKEPRHTEGDLLHGMSWHGMACWPAGHVQHGMSALKQACVVQSRQSAIAVSAAC